MLTNLILFLSIVLGCISLTIIYQSRVNKKSTFINKYLVFLIIIITLRHIFHFIYSLQINILANSTLLYVDSTILISIPCFYLYFEDLVFENKLKAKKLIHFAIPVLMIILLITSHFKGYPNLYGQLLILLGAIFGLGYLFAGFNLLRKNIWNRKSEIIIIQEQNNLIKRWTLFSFIIFILLFVSRFFMLTILKLNIGYNHELTWVTAIIWCSIFIKIILTPELTYGYNFFKEKIDSSSKQIALPELWNFNKPIEAITASKDNKLSEKVVPLLKEYIHKIEETSFHSHEFRKPDLSIDDLASHLGIPSSHLSFVFKYFCKDTFVDYKKLVRVHDAIKLMESGYLKSNTIESLSVEVGFLTYNTFHVAFKSITGVTTHEYFKRL